MKPSANLGMMFRESGPVTARYKAASEAGFTAVEWADEYSTPLEALVAAREGSGLHQVLINAPQGDRERNEEGLAALPNKEAEFINSIDLAVQYAKALNCTRVHVKAGRIPTQWLDTAMNEVYIDNMRYAADRMAKEGIVCLVEPISTVSIPGYYLDHPDKAVDLIKKVNHPNLRLLLDIFHLQIICGDLTRNLEKYLPYTEHIQVSQVPNRHELDSEGEINYKYIFKVLRDLKYTGYIGLEYVPSGKTEDSLGWMKTML